MTINNSTPLFLSAPRVIITVDNMLVGMAIGLNFNISIDVQPIYTMGQYGPAALEPTFYNVITGTIQLIRLSRPTARNDYIQNSADPGNTTALDWDGEQAGNNKGTTDVQTNSPSLLGQSALYTHLDPASVAISRLFDMSIKVRVLTDRKIPSLDKDGTKILDSLGKPVLVAMEAQLEQQNWMAIRGCRITGRTTNITFGQIINEPLNFSGLLVTPVNARGEDVFSADNYVKQT